MSRPRSRSPNYRRFPWEEPDFDAQRLLSELDGIPMDRSHHFREGPEEPRDYFRKQMYPEGQRRSPSFPDNHQFGRRPDQEEFYQWRPSPHRGLMRYEDQRLPPPHDGANDGRRGGFREHPQSFEARTRSPQSPLRLNRERLTPTPRPQSAQRDAVKGWRREELGRGRGRLRDVSPGTRPDDQRAAADRVRGKRTMQGSNRGRQRENPHHERSLAFKRQRREMDDADQFGYREEFGEQGYSVDPSGDGFGGDSGGKLPLGDVRRSRPVVIEHGHGIREVPRWEHIDNRRDREPDFDRQRSPRPRSSSQERFRMPDSRLDGREDTREWRFQDNPRDSNYHEARRSPVQDRPNTMGFDNRAGPMNQMGRGSDRPLKRNYNQAQSGRTGQPRNQPRLQKSYQERPHEDQRPGFRPFREDYEDHIEVEPNWAEEDKPQQWNRPGSLDRDLNRDLDPKMPRQRQQGWINRKTDNATVVTEETLTIKVDMSRPVNQNSSLCYSSDRQLSLDLVNVGRQRLDFLPMLEHSGTYRETAMHTGTFAQEIITLVHLVKDQYFRDDGVTLNERFSAPQKGGFIEEEEDVEEMTLDQRFSSNRGFSLEMSSLLHDDEPLFSRLGPMQGLSQQPIRGPGDLRHDLERRRQEKLEGVKVTIPGSSIAQRPLGPVSELDLDYSEQMDHEGLSNWPEEQNRRRDGNMGPRRGPSNRLNMGPQRRNNRFNNRRQNFHSSPTGPSW
ncbi:BCLAF1 and THRAP3 family member 3 [Acanthochromis polyacanthus]|uniref:BCLAF1 and THRAP3 family member 3 n=1 Tax=Acanthochromis polyacanthus TaxID=80966 RepID=UPI0022347421|nr:BCLAF1 and THRAP3 family member 3 [Acanthochromis polyacanthus]